MRRALLLTMLLAVWPGQADSADNPLERAWRGDGRSKKLAGPLKLLVWNIERGLDLPGIVAVLERYSPDIALLQEVDVNARRTNRRNIAEDLARRFEWNWAFAAEFEELGQGSASSAAYVGQVVLSRLPIRDARILRFKEQTDYWQPRWYVPNWSVFQRRRGGRIALVTELASDHGPLVAYNAHLESRGPEERRLRQIEEILSDNAKYAPDTPIIVAGDFNTRSRPSPVIARLLKAGFAQAAGSEKSTSARGAALDWIFVRGVSDYRDGAVLHDVHASDHYPLTVQLSMGR
jgi:endonuclease/exonuclease/phosphatase family metal-dependent hydrolase